jgi:hypothetical protein
MNEFNELDILFDSQTIRPSFDYVHVLLSILLYGENPEGFGRYRLENELLIGSGTSKSLVKRLRENGKYIKVPEQNKKNNQDLKRKGHVLTEKGLDLLTKIKKKFPILKEADTEFLKEIIIDSMGAFSFFCLIKNAVQNLGDGIAQRDAAIMIGGSGTTCLVYNGNKVIFPDDYAVNERDIRIPINQDIQTYFKAKIINSNVIFERGDVIIIGLGDNLKKARLAALNAALSLIKK